MMNVPFALAALVVAVTLSGCASPNAPGLSSPAGAESPAPSGGSAAGSAAGTPTGSRAAAAAPAAGAAQTGASAPAADLPSVRLSPEILFQILAADIAVQRGEFGAAWNTYMSLARQTRDPRLARRATETAFSARALGEATQSATLWRELAPQSAEAAQALEALWLNTGRLTEVEPLLRGLVGPRMLELGLIARADDRGDPVLQFAPPLVAGPDELEELVGIVRKVLTEVGTR
jgi:hypothetical protein